MAKLDRAKRAEFLKRLPLFEGLSAQQLEELAQTVRGLTCKRKEELFHKGDEGTDIYVVVSGKLKALTTSVEGDDVVFEIMNSGDVFGEIAMLAGLPRTASVVAIEPCELLCLARRDLLYFLNRHPDASVQMLALVAKRLAGVSELVEDTLFLNLPIRLAKKLVNFADTYGQKTPSGVRLDVKLSQTEWGDLVGTTRESINKQMRAWTKDGLVSIDDGYIVIHRFEELERLSDAALV
jgi:CRP/FNR family cyclic AMP-dependent transcriptional regulator